MHSKLFHFVSKANQYLLFFGSLLVLLFFAFLFAKEFLRDNTYRPPQVEIVSTDPGKSAPVNVIYTKRYVAAIKDVHILDIESNQINPEKKHKRNSGNIEIVNHFSGGSADYKSSSTVNMMFVTQEQDNYLLFEQDKFIDRRSLAQFETSEDRYNRNYISFKNAYLVAEEDTNSDGFLSSEDKLNFYLSDYDGKQLTLMLENVSDFSYQADHQILLTKGYGPTKSFYILDTLNNSLVKLATEIE